MPQSNKIERIYKKPLALLSISLLTAIFVLQGCALSNPFVPSGEEYRHTSYKSVQQPIKSDIMYKATMRPYSVNGTRYIPSTVRIGEKFTGVASWYGPNFHGLQTSNGEYYDMYTYTAAHKTLPINTMVKVTNLKNGLSTVVRINDRGPFVKDRIIDLSYIAAKEIGVLKHGTAKVELEVIGFDQKANKYAHKPILQTQRTKLPKIEKSSQTLDKIGFGIQIASFSDQNKALEFKRKCYNDKLTHPIVIKTKEIANKPIYTIVISGFSTKEKAKEHIRKYGFKDAFVIRN